jgi:hypothetical protein
MSKTIMSAAVLTYGVVFAGLAGWVMNVYKLITATSWEPVEAMSVARAIGVLVAPLGAVLGWF